MDTAATLPADPQAITVSWQDGQRNADADFDTQDVFYARPLADAANAALLGRVVQPKADGITNDASPSVTFPRRSSELRGVAVGVFRMQDENDDGSVDEDFGDVVLVRIGVPTAGAPLASQTLAAGWYVLKVADIVIVEGA